MATYRGIQESLYVSFCSGALPTLATTHYEAGKSGLSKEQQQEVESIVADIDKVKSESRQKLVKLESFDAMLAHARETEALVAEKQARMSAIVTGSMESAFESMLAALDVKPAKVVARESELPTNVLYEVIAHGYTRYYWHVKTDEKSALMVYELEKNKAKKLYELDKNNFSKIFPGSVTAIQRMHYIMYAPSEHAFESTRARLDACNNANKWYEPIGISQNTNGKNATTTLSQTPESWLKDHA